MSSPTPETDSADLCAIQDLHVTFNTISDQFRTRHRQNPDRQNAMICSSMVAVKNAFGFLSDQIRELGPEL